MPLTYIFRHSENKKKRKKERYYGRKAILLTSPLISPFERLGLSPALGKNGGKSATTMFQTLALHSVKRVV